MTEENKTETRSPEEKFLTEDLDKPLSRQEENWMLMTTLQIPWKDANGIDDKDDRAFLLAKVKEVQQFMQRQQEQQMQQQQMQQQQMAAGQQPQAPESSIITPQDILAGK